MGNQTSKTNEIIEISYKTLSRRTRIKIFLNDDFPYPRRPKNNEIEKQLTELSRDIVLTEEQQKLLEQQGFDTKWKLICKHRFMLLTSADENAKSTPERLKIELYIEELRDNSTAIFLDDLRQFLLNEASEEEKSIFLLEGLALLIAMLERAEICSRGTKNCTKQLTILKIIENLLKFKPTFQYLLQIPNAVSIIFMNFSQENIALTTITLEILNYLCWNSQKGLDSVLQALNYYKMEKNGKHRFEPLVNTLDETKDAIFVEILVTFVNVIIESHVEDDRRQLIRSEFSNCGLKNIYEDIKEKIHEEKYILEESSLDPFLSKAIEEEVPKALVERAELEKKEEKSRKIDQDSSIADSNEDSEDSEEESSPRVSQKNSSIQDSYPDDRKLRSSISINANVEIFQKHLKIILDQIELFENGFQEFNEIITDTKEFEKVDLSDLRNLFEILKTGAIDKEHFKYLLAIMQHLLLIPDTERGVKIWKYLCEMIMEIISGTKKDSNLKVKNLRKLFYEAQSIGELENQVKHLENTLWFREQEIEKIINEKRKTDVDLRHYEEDIKKAELVINQQCELTRLMELKLANDEARLGRIIEEKDEKIKLLEQKTKDLAKTLSYAPSFSSINTSTTLNSSSLSKPSDIEVFKTGSKSNEKNANLLSGSKTSTDSKLGVTQGHAISSKTSGISGSKGLSNAMTSGTSKSLASKDQKKRDDSSGVDRYLGVAEVTYGNSGSEEVKSGFKGKNIDSSRVNKVPPGNKSDKINDGRTSTLSNEKNIGVAHSNSITSSRVASKEREASIGQKPSGADSFSGQKNEVYTNFQTQIEELEKENRRLLQEIDILRNIQIGNSSTNEGAQTDRRSESFKRNMDSTGIKIISESGKSKEVVDLEKEVELLKRSLREVTEASKNKRLSISNLQTVETGQQNIPAQKADQLNALPNLNEARRRTRTEFFHVPLRDNYRASILKDAAADDSNRISSLTSSSNPFSDTDISNRTTSGRTNLDPLSFGESPIRGNRISSFRMSITGGYNYGLSSNGEGTSRSTKTAGGEESNSGLQKTTDYNLAPEGDHQHVTILHSSLKQRSSILAGMGAVDYGNKQREKTSSKERSVKFNEDNLEEIQEEPAKTEVKGTRQSNETDEEEKNFNSGNKPKSSSLTNTSMVPPSLTTSPGITPPLIGGPVLPPPILGGPGLPPPLLGGPGLPPPLLGGPGFPPPLLGGPPLINLFGNNQRGSISKPKRKPRVPMKSLMWRMLSSNSTKGTIWAEIDDLNEVFNEDKLEEEFSQKRRVEHTEDVKKQPVIKQKVTTLTPDRNKNIELILNRLKISNSSLCEALITMNEGVLTFNNVTSLSQIIPTEQELQILLNYTGDKGELANPDKFFLELCEVPGYSERIQAMKFYQTVQELIDDLEIKTDKIYSLFTMIPKDGRLYKLLQMILAVGNYLNGESARGGCFGFKTDTLEKVAEVKSNDGKKTLLQFIIETLEKKEENEKFIDINEDLTIFEIASKTSITQLTLDLKDIIKGAKIVEEAMNKQSELPNDRVQEFFMSFSILINEKSKHLDINLKSCIEAYEYCCKFFGENPKDTSSEVFSQSMMKFWLSCKKCKQAMIKLAELQKKEDNKRRLNKSQTIQVGHEAKNVSGNELRLDHANELAEAMRLRRTERKTIHKKANIMTGSPIDEVESPKIALVPPTRNTTGSPQSRQSALFRNITMV